MKTKKWSSILICWAKKEMGKYASHTHMQPQSMQPLESITSIYLSVGLSIYHDIISYLLVPGISGADADADIGEQ